jgi:hypothetical protein
MSENTARKVANETIQRIAQLAAVDGALLLIKSHAVRHALKEGFERTHMVEAILEGIIIEEYPDEQRVLICGKTTLARPPTFICTSPVNMGMPSMLSL